MKKLMTNLILFALLMLPVSQALAASCPYCGWAYGVAGPGDSARINALRRSHEASCRIKQSSRSSKSTRTHQYTSPSSRKLERPRTPGTIDQSKMRTPYKKKGVHFKEVPSPKPVIPKYDPYSAYTAKEIVSEALKIGHNNLERAIDHLEGYRRRENPHNVKVKEALSFLQGRQAGGAFVDDREETLFDPDVNDSYNLLGDVSGINPYTMKRPDPENFDDWKVERTNLFLESLERGDRDWNKSKRYLEQRIKADPDDYTARNAKAYLEGFLTEQDNKKQFD